MRAISALWQHVTDILLVLSALNARGRASRVSEDKSPFINSGFGVDNVAEGFAVRKFAPSAIATEFECVICKCKVLVK